MQPALELTLEVGSVFQGGYEILFELGTGSFGRVYKARQLSTSQQVAIKILRLRRGDAGPDVELQMARFRREMRLCGELTHPNIVRLVDSGETSDGVLYAVFEFVPGVTLKAILAEEGKLAVREAVHLMGQVLDALACAHARGVVHRDLKPENVMITKTGARRNALVVDFGLSGLAREVQDWDLPRLTATAEMMGTPCYAAPEQLLGEPPSSRSDLYSWGLMLLECLTGELAVSGATAQEVIHKQLGPEAIGIPEWIRSRRLRRVLEAATAKQIDRRTVTAEDLLRALVEMDVDELDDRDSAPAPALPEAERRQLTLVCCRLRVTNVEGGVPDLEELDEVLHAEQAIWAELAGRSEGRVGAVMGDRVLLAFGFPQAHEDDARRAARTALEIASEVERTSARLQSERRLRLDARIGVHTGLVVVREPRGWNRTGVGDLVGQTPQIAASIQEQAEPGEVLASLDTLRLLRGQIGAEPAGELQLAERPGSLPLFRLTARRPTVGGLETIAPALETPLVGRANQLAELITVWRQAEAGRAGAAYIRGEPGIGKSRLVRELRRQVPPQRWLECRCVAEQQAAPLRPFADLLSAIDEPFESLLSRHGFDLTATVPLFSGLIHEIPDRYPPLNDSRERQKELTLSALLTLLLRMSEAEPLALAIEDLHLADPTSLELVDLLLEQVRSARALEGQAGPRLCLVLTARPEFTARWPTEDVAVIQPPRLVRHEVEEIVAGGLARGRPLPRTVFDEIIRRADGIPLFAEEVTRVLAESAAAGADVSAPELEIPGTLRDLLAARLDGLSSAARETAQLAAVLGREFRYEVLEAVSATSDFAIEGDLAELMRAGLVFRRWSQRNESYLFKHALLRDAAYESLVRPARQKLHRRIAEVLKQRFPDVEEHQPEILAHHFEKGGDIEIAVAYWHRAGDRAMKRGAYVEAAQQLEKGLALLRAQPRSLRGDHLEIELLLTLGTVQFSTKGYGSEDVERTFSRARELGELLREGISPQVLTGIMGVHFTRSDRESTAALLPLFHELAGRADLVSAITGHATLGLAALFEGDLAKAHDYLTQARSYYGTEFQRFAQQWGYDGGMLVYAWQMVALWQMGFPDRAEALRREMLSIAEESQQPYSILLALSFGTTLTEYRGDTETTLELAGRLMTLSTEQRLYAWLASAMVAQGSTALRGGDAESAIAQIRQGLDLFRAAGVLLSYSWFLPDLAAAYAAAGKVDDGLATVEEGLSRCERELLRFHEPELHRMRGELAVLQGDASTAEASFHRALEIARQRGAKSLELRAAVSSSRLWRAQGKIEEARALLGGVYGWFTEGFETRDLREARALIADLA